MFKKYFNLKSIIIILSIIGSCLVIISTINYDLGLSDDAISYLAAADNLLKGRGFMDFNGQPLLEWPPLYPFLLFVLSSLSGFDTLRSALFLNVLLFGLIIYKSGMIFRTYLTSKFLILAGVFLILFSRPIFYRTLDALSDLTFIFLILWYMYFLALYIEKKKLLSLTMIIILTSLSILTRFIGLACIFTTTVTILLLYRETLKKKIIIFAYTFLSIVPISIWFIRTYLVSKNLSGPRGISRYTLYDNIYLTIKGMLEWHIPVYIIEHKVLLILTFFVVIAAGIYLYKKIKDLLQENSGKILVISSSFIFGYLFLLVLLSSLYAHDPIDSRLLAPVYIPLLFLFLIPLQSYLSGDHFNKLKVSKIILAFVFIAVVCTYPFLSTLKKMDKHITYGSGYSGLTWKNSNLELLKHISYDPSKKMQLYSNAPQAVYYITKAYTIWSPWKTYYNSDQTCFNLQDLKGRWPTEKEAYLVWFRQIDDINGWLYKINELASVSEMKMSDSSRTICIYNVKHIPR